MSYDADKRERELQEAARRGARAAETRARNYADTKALRAARKAREALEAIRACETACYRLHQSHGTPHTRELRDLAHALRERAREVLETV